ncbi:outer membrane beta-barrel protein [Vibrio sp. BS-M-Sm-2]|uniref:outer membrane beta-barrel protein n=1 Tax=Vibrio sp. BS-M-Sm-2 TaxID=3241167 RepID=UPI0035570D45
MKTKILLIALLIVNAEGVKAKQPLSPVQISSGVVFSVFDNDKADSEALGYSVGAGYNVNSHLRLGLEYSGFGALGGADSGLSTTILDASLLLPLSDYSSLYIGAGGGLSTFSDELNYSQIDTNVTASLGMQYALTKNWIADISYRGIFDLQKWQDDLYSFNVRVAYRFSNSEESYNSEHISKSYLEHRAVKITTLEESKNQKEPELRLANNQQNISKPVNLNPCKKVTQSYQVQTGDHLNKLAKLNQVSLTEILEVNRQLSNRDVNLLFPGEVIKIPQFSCD